MLIVVVGGHEMNHTALTVARRVSSLSESVREDLALGIAEPSWYLGAEYARDNAEEIAEALSVWYASRYIMSLV